MTQEDSSFPIDAKSDLRPYSKPRILFRESVEAMATSCLTPGSKPDPITCSGGPLQS